MKNSTTRQNTALVVLVATIYFASAYDASSRVLADEDDFVFTVFFCGTGSNSLDVENDNYFAGELVSTLAQNHAGTEFVDWIIVDGPGSGNLHEDEKWIPQDKTHSELRGTLLGAGWKENVQHALAVVKGKYERKKTKLTKKQYTLLKQSGVPIDTPKFSNFYHYPNSKITKKELEAQIKIISRKIKIPTKINAIGWSRGGVTCHMFAHALAKDPKLKNIPVNVFVVDPVPGLGQFANDRTTIPANVKSYVAIYARDEYSLGFSPTVADIRDAKETAVKILAMPGNHATLVGNACNKAGKENDAFKAPGQIVRDLAEKTLSDWGTKFVKEKTLSLDDSEILEKYKIIQENDDYFLELRKESYTKKTSKKVNERDMKVGDKAKKTPFSKVAGLETQTAYVNLHHLELAKSAGIKLGSPATKSSKSSLNPPDKKSGK